MDFLFCKSKFPDPLPCLLSLRADMFLKGLPRETSKPEEMQGDDGGNFSPIPAEVLYTPHHKVENKEKHLLLFLVS